MKFIVFALFYFVFEGNFQVQAPPGGLHLEGQFNGGFFALRVWGAYNFGGAYTWRGLFSEFYGMSLQLGKLHGHLLDGSGPRQNVKSTNYSMTCMQWP